ncbi:MAG: superoxide dismutase [Desulfuromonadales bacterium GWD2_61_12]|nr:MAG: superoxide dismutase [Desulfuromonadales bacterium GWC2_61_20]OGR33153.1 MAG: superoxide dismutase [Desulfuromonadales bacterium GWD2_61_12]HAD03720.1 superoxide dismutase [Fe] [Desulfuromonas sp.]
MPITLPALPFAPGALEPHISARTFEFHHGKHHKAYVDNTNKLIEGTDLAGKELEAIIKAAAADPSKKGLFNNSAQVWNHSFFWQCLKPGGGGKPSGKIAAKIEAELGGYDKFAADFKNAGVTQFGSGWAWLVLKDGKLAIVQSANAETPLVQGLKPLLVADVWEHAYYLDYQNRRPDFLQAFLDHLINWDFANANLG